MANDTATVPASSRHGWWPPGSAGCCRATAPWTSANGQSGRNRKDDEGDEEGREGGEGGEGGEVEGEIEVLEERSRGSRVARPTARSTSSACSRPPPGSRRRRRPARRRPRRGARGWDAREGEDCGAVRRRSWRAPPASAARPPAMAPRRWRGRPGRRRPSSTPPSSIHRSGAVGHRRRARVTGEGPGHRRKGPGHRRNARAAEGSPLTPAAPRL